MACSLRQAQRRAEVAEQRAETSEAQTRPMTLDEYIAACHTFLFSRLSIETGPKLALRGSIIRSALRIVSHRTPVFENRDFLADLGNRIAQRPIADEKTLESFLHDSVEDPEEEVRRSFQIGDGIIFENHLHALSDVAEGAIERKTQSTPPRTPDHRRDLKQLRPDQICVYRSDNTASSRRTMLCISEYKPPHKLSSQHLRAGLRITDIHEEKSLEYGLLTTGEAIVFLKVDWNDPETHYYHLAEPGPEVTAHPNNLQMCTAVGQYLASILMALGSPGEQQEIWQEERMKSMENLKRFNESVIDIEACGGSPAGGQPQHALFSPRLRRGVCLWS
ncbi:hypothetical protein FOQG_16489 [Fusarium oxysporum f. sp. raphani 54005]|uniref:Uncharacterized protein n=1 Tax=Fusarium oxysporum f. sp. raphani 54005 TaxID=1089458 RepID=X0BK71_FUSOX|nr:hypothetical protein FOQG_16489 [Fusarium oxysporum f. sp. raphani 54005]